MLTDWFVPMTDAKEPPLVPPLPPDLLFLHPPASAGIGVSSSSIIKDSVMTEVSTTSVETVSPSPVPVVHPSDTTSPVVAPVTNSTPPVAVSGDILGSSSSPIEEATPKVPSSQDADFNWLSRAKATRKFPNSSIPVTRSEEGVPRVKVPNAVFERGAKAHSDYIVGIFYGNAPSYGKIWGVLNYLWGRDRRVTIHNLSKNAYLFYIPSVSLRQKILQHELWRVGDSPFFVTEWKASFSIDPPSLQRAPIWATLNKVPFDLLTDEGLEIITRPLGRIVDAKPFSSVSSVDVKVVVDLTVKLPATVEIERENGAVDLLEVTYPWLPPLCPVCNEIGHKANFCPTRKSHSSDQEKVGSKKPARSSKKAKDKVKEQVPAGQQKTVPVKTCLNSVLSDLSLPSEKGSVGDAPVPSCTQASLVEELPLASSTVSIPEEAQDSSFAFCPPEPSLVTETPAPRLPPTAPSAILVPDPELSNMEVPFLPAVHTVPSKSVEEGLQEGPAVISENPFAILIQEEEPPTTFKEESDLALGIDTPTNKQTYSGSSLSKKQKNKKRKLAKRSPNSGGSPPLLTGGNTPQ